MAVHKQVTGEQMDKLKKIVATLPEPALQELAGFIRGVLQVAQENGNDRRSKKQ